MNKIIDTPAPLIFQQKETEENFEMPSEPETRLSQMELDELVLEYETATKERQEDIEKLLEKYENVKPSAVKQFIERQKEILLETKNLEVSVSEKFAEELASEGETEEKKTFIKETVLKVINGEEIPKSVEAKEIKLKTEEFIEKHRAELEEEKIQKINQAFEDAAREAPNDQQQLIRQYGKNIIKLNKADIPNIGKDMSDVGTMMEANGVSPGVVSRAKNDINTLTHAIYTNPGELKNIYKDIQSLDMAGLQQKYLPNIPEVRSFQSFIKAVDVDKEAVLGLQNMVHAKIEMVEGAGKFVSKWVPGGKALVGKVSEKIGGIAVKEFLKGSMEVLAKEGLITGAKTIMQGVMLGSTGAAEAAGGTALVTTMAGLFAALPPAAIAILAVMAVIGTYVLGYKIYDTVAGWVRNTTGVNFLWGVRDTISGWFGNGWFGKTVGTLGQFAFNSGAVVMGGLAMLFGPIMARGLASMTAIVAPVIIALVTVFMTYNGLVTSPMIASQVPPPPQATGGTCKPKEPAASGSINCDQNAPEAKISISKEDFDKFADDWNMDVATGKVIGDPQAKECFNDVVAQAKCAGIVPEYALWAWLHESGASNYKRFPDVSDFGITYKKHNDFKEQITEFMKLDPASKCLNDPRIKGDYWLAFSTNYLSASKTNDMCDPLAKDSKGVDGFAYRDELLSSWTRLGQVPKSIHGTKDPASCKSSAVATADNEYVKDGVVMVCDGPVDDQGNFVGTPGSSTYDKDAQGKLGAFINGKCSVSSKVVQTNQCQESWSNMALPGPVINTKYGLGTICSAGCGPTSASMLLRRKNNSLTPNSVIWRDKGAYRDMYGKGSGLADAKKELEFWGFTGLIHKVGCSPEDVGNWICEGNAVMLRADSDLGNGNTTGHMLVAKAVSDGKIIVSDPYFKNDTPFHKTGAGHISPSNLTECLIIPVGLDAEKTDE